MRQILISVRLHCTRIPVVYNCRKFNQTVDKLERLQNKKGFGSERFRVRKVSNSYSPKKRFEYRIKNIVDEQTVTSFYSDHKTGIYDYAKKVVRFTNSLRNILEKYVNL